MKVGDLVKFKEGLGWSGIGVILKIGNERLKEGPVVMEIHWLRMPDGSSGMASGWFNQGFLEIL